MTALTVLAALDTNTYRHNPGDLPGLVQVREQIIDHGRWTVTYLTVYLHAQSGTYAGVLERRSATENQEGDEEPDVVAVEMDPTPHFRIKRTP